MLVPHILAQILVPTCTLHMVRVYVYFVCGFKVFVLLPYDDFMMEREAIT